jgi:DNA-binding CsgD family transcriptional regulator
MVDFRDAAWRFINVAPVTANQAMLDNLFAETLLPFGVDRFDCGHVPPHWVQRPDYVSCHGLSEWKRYYFDQRYNETDPCHAVHWRSPGSYTWTQARSMTASSASQIWGDARAGGMGEGLIIPIAPGRRTEAAVRLTTPEDSFDPEVLPLLQSMAVIYAFSTVSLTRADGDADERQAPGLTEREIECLHWSARGKTNAEIGSIIAISRHTVNTHIESAKRKLGVATRVQAVALAHQLGLLSIA